MASSPKTNVFFTRVRDNRDKIQSICKKAQEALANEKRLLIAVADIQAAQYVDVLLWKEPAESFLPHAIADASTHEWIAITTQNKLNVNQACRLLNLSPLPPPFWALFEEVYEWFDESHMQKKEQSIEKMNYYRSQNLEPKLF